MVKGWEVKGMVGRKVVVRRWVVVTVILRRGRGKTGRGWRSWKEVHGLGG